MLVFLLFLASGLYFVHSNALHMAALLLHGVWLLWIAARRFSQQPLTSLFIFAYIAMYLPNPVAIGAGWMPMERDTPPEIFFQANALLLIGLDLFVIAATYFRRPRYDLNTLPVTQLSRQSVENTTLLILIACAGVTGGLILAIFAMGQNIFSVEKSFRASFGIHNLFYNAATFLYILLPIAGFLIGLRKLGTQSIYLIAIFCLLVVHFLIFRIRTVPIAFLMGYGFGFYASYRHVLLTGEVLRGRIPMLLKAAIVIIIPMGIFLGVGIKYLRYSYHQDDMSINKERVEYVMVHSFSGGDLGYTLFLRKAMTRYPDPEPYLMGQSYYRLLFMPIPRSAWPGKPENTQRIFARALGEELYEKGVTIPPGIVGDLYINFGRLGVLGMIGFGLVFRQERYRGFGALLFVAASGGWLFHLTRGALTNPIIWIVWILIVIFFILRRMRPNQVHRGWFYQQPQSA